MAKPLGKAYAKPIEMKAPKTTAQPHPPSGGPGARPALAGGGMAGLCVGVPGTPREALKHKVQRRRVRCCSPRPPVCSDTVQRCRDSPGDADPRPLSLQRQHRPNAASIHRFPPPQPTPPAAHPCRLLLPFNAKNTSPVSPRLPLRGCGVRDGAPGAPWKIRTGGSDPC